MKPNELMYGDWVYIEDASAPNGLSITNVVCICDDNTEWLHPIPLTAEILEKNGFKKTTDEKYYMCDDYSELSAEEYSDSIWLICCSDIECNLPVQKIMVSYIHQLQQFLRLCGDENLANNFKV